MIAVFAVLVLALLALTAAVFAASRWQSNATGIPASANVIYADTGAWERIERPFFSLRYGLTGKPDYVLEKDRFLIPVEVKPQRRDSTPRDSDVMQLAAYGLLVEEWRGIPPPYGLLKYRDAIFTVDFTEDLRTRLLCVLDAMRQDLEPFPVPRSHSEPARCRGCGFRSKCSVSLYKESDRLDTGETAAQ